MEDRADWRQSRLDAYAAAVTVRDQARARYDAAKATYDSAVDALKEAEANLAKAAKPGKARATFEVIDAMSSGQRQQYLETWAKNVGGGHDPTILDSDFLYAKCRYGGLDAGACSDYARQRQAGELDGPLGTLVVAPLAALSLAAIVAYLAAHPEVFGRVAPPPQPSIAQLLRPGGQLIGTASKGGDPLARDLPGGVDEAQALFTRLTQGGTVISNSTYSGTLIRLSNGGTVGLRLVSRSSGPTIDIDAPGWGAVVSKTHFQ